MTTDKDLQALLGSFHQDFELEEKARAELMSRCRHRELRKRQLLLQEGDVCRHLSFVIKGCFRMFAVDHTGKESIISFFVENDWVADLGSFYEEEPSRTYIEAIEPSAILQLSRQDVYFLYTHSLKFNLMIRVMVENKFVELQSRVLQQISSSAESNYLSFLKRYPELSQRIPNTYIASYLGITPEFLSKIRKKLAAKAKRS